MSQNPLTDAIDRLRAQQATETCQFFRDGDWLLTATLQPTLTADQRGQALELLPVATLADRVQHVSFTTAILDEARSDAVSWLDAPIGSEVEGAAAAQLVMYPFSQVAGAQISWGEPVVMAEESAMFGGLLDAFSSIAPGLSSATPGQLDALRASAIDHLLNLDVAVEMSESFSAELKTLFARIG